MFAPHNRSAGLAAATAAVATFTLIILRQRQQRKLKGLANDASYNGYTELRPPFPSEIIALFEVASLCYLSTTIDNAPHISLMNFTYDRDSELLIFTTRRDTQKCSNLVRNPRVAILLHDFPHLKDTGAGDEGSRYGRTCAITLYGTASVLDDNNSQSKALREKHLARNTGGAVFINGPGIAVIAVVIDCARVCDDKDKVSSWSASKGWEMPPGGPSAQKP